MRPRIASITTHTAAVSNGDRTPRRASSVTTTPTSPTVPAIGSTSATVATVPK